MEFAVPYEAIDYKTALDSRHRKFVAFKTHKIDNSIVNRLTPIGASGKPGHQKKEAKDFICKNGPLLSSPYDAALEIASGKLPPDSDDAVECQVGVVMEAADVLRFAMLLRKLLDDMPGDFLEKLEGLGVTVDYVEPDDKEGIDSVTGLPEKEDDNGGPKLERLPYVHVQWERAIECEEYYIWLRSHMLGDNGFGRNPDGSLTYQTVTYSGEVDFEKGSAAKKASAVMEAASELLDWLVADHLRDMRVVTVDGEPKMYPGTLLSAIWFCAAKKWSKKEIKVCTACGSPFIASNRVYENAAKRKPTCSDACRQKVHRDKKRAEERRKKMAAASKTRQPEEGLDAHGRTRA